MRGLGDPDAFPASDLGLAGRQTAGPAAARRAHRAQRAGGDPGAPMPPSTCGPLSSTRSTNGRHRRSHDRSYRTIDSPIGPLTLAGRGSMLTNLRMVDQTYEPSRAGWSLDHARLRRCRRATGRVLRRRAARLRPRIRPARHRIPAAGLGRRCSPSRTGRRDPTDRSPTRSAHRLPHAPSAWPTATTRSASSSRAIASSAPMAALPATAAGSTERRTLLDMERNQRRPCGIDAIRLNLRRACESAEKA